MHVESGHGVVLTGATAVGKSQLPFAKLGAKMKILNEDTKQILVEKWKFNADFGKVVGFGRFSPQSVFSTPLLPF